MTRSSTGSFIDTALSKVRTALPVAMFAATTLTAANASAVLIDFETDGSGTPIVGNSSVSQNEYAGDGVGLRDSDPAAGSTFTNVSNGANVGTSIQGNYLNIGAFSGVDTFLEITLAPGSNSVSFDWASGADATEILVSLYDTSDALIGGGSIASLASGSFVNGAGFSIPSGSFAYAGLDEIARIFIEDQATGNRALIVDNLNFTPVPEPGAALLIGLGLAGLSATGRRTYKVA